MWQPRRGVFAFTVVCKATYRLQAGVSPLADEQEPIHASDRHWHNNHAASLYAPTDLAPYKRRADVLLVGSAFAPGGLPVRSLVATLEVGDVHKSVEVCCDRSYTYDGHVLEGATFTRMPLRWERAAGGPETVNPVGVRFPTPPFSEARRSIANLQPPGSSVTRAGDGFEPVGFGPIAAEWPGRAWLLQGNAGQWPHTRWAEGPLPPFVDPRFFNAAPPDQQTDTLEADARIVLMNLHPSHPRLVTNLEAVRPYAVVERPGRAPAPVVLACDTLWIDTDREICTLTFRGSTAIAGADEPGQVVVSLPAGSARPRSGTLTDESARVAAVRGGLPFVPSKVAAEAQAPRVHSFAGLPFRPAVEAAQAPEVPAKAAPRAQGMWAAEEATATITLPSAAARAGGVAAEPAARAPALPFTKRDPRSSEPESAASGREPQRAKSAWGEEHTATVQIDRLRAQRSALPFGPGAMEQPAPPVAPPPPAAPAPSPAPSAPPAFWQKLVETKAAAQEDEPEPETLRPPPPPPDGVAAGVPAPLDGGGLGALASLGASGAPTETRNKLGAMRLGAPKVPSLQGFAAAPLGAPPAAPPIVAEAPRIVAEAPRIVVPAPAPIEPRAAEAEAAAPAGPIALDVFAAAKVSFWKRDPRAGAEVAEAHGMSEDDLRAGEERLLEAIEGEAREGHAGAARALRAALRRAAREASHSRSAREARSAPDASAMGPRPHRPSE